MAMNKCAALFLAASLSLLSAQHASAQFKFGTSSNPAGHTVTVDRHGVMMDGKYVIPVMGEIHYSRVPREDWRREIRKMRAGGITIVSTYVFWNHHEAEEGRWDWSGNRDLHHFLEVCRDESMPVVLRVGPFCHGEVVQGGFPDWLVRQSLGQEPAADGQKAAFKLRSEAPQFIAATERLFSNIYAQSHDMLWKNGGTIIGIQIENECRGPWNYYMRLKQMAVGIGFDLPFYTRTGWPKLNGGERDFGQMLPLYGDYADGFWDRVLTDMPGEYPQAFIMKDSRLSSVIATEALGTNQDTKMEQKDLQYPYLTCELGGGMMPSYHRRINMSGREMMPLAICKLGSGSNLPGYYMYHGGSNPVVQGHTMAECQATAVTNYNDMPHVSYDFQAPLGEMGQPSAVSFREGRWLHQFLADWGSELALMDVDSLSEHYARRGCFEFRNDYVRILNEGGSASVTPNGMKWEGHVVTTRQAQPFAKTYKHLWLIDLLNPETSMKPTKTVEVIIDGKKKQLRVDKEYVFGSERITVLSKHAAAEAYVIDNKMKFSAYGGILYKNDKGDLVSEYWSQNDKALVERQEIRPCGPLRTIAMGSQKVAEQPSDADFDNAAAWSLKLQLPQGADAADFFLRVDYQGDAARVYADGQLVQDNFWNGKPMLVRASDLVGRDVRLCILPLAKNAPIYLQKEQRACLDAAPGDYLLSLDGLRMMQRHLEEVAPER